MYCDKEKLILVVRERPGLYDFQNPNHRDKAYLTDVWNEVGKELGISGKTAKEKWRNLRDTYVRKKKLFDHRRQSGFTAEPKWSYFKNLSFLDEFMQPRRSDITISPRAMTDVIVYAPFSDPHNDEDEEQQGEIVNYTDEALPSESRSSVVKRRLHTPIGRPSSSLMRQKKRKKMTMSDVDFEERYDEMTQGGSAQYTEPMKEDSIPSLYARVVEVRLEEIPKNIHKAFFEISAILEKYEREENGFGEERSE